MALTFIEDAESRQNLGFSGIIQQNKATPASDDYPTGGYLINPQNWGLGFIRGLLIMGMTGTAPDYIWQYVPAAATSVTSTYSGNLFAYSALGTQVAAATDLSGGSLLLLAYGF